jgi:hypothetical protein
MSRFPAPVWDKQGGTSFAGHLAMVTETGLPTSPIDEKSPETTTERTPRFARAGHAVFVATVAVAVVAGALLRSWYFFHTPSSSDQAIVGLMANAILHGHFSAFYWGQAYGGVEPYAVAGMFALFGHSAATLNLTPAVLSGAAALVTWRAALRLVRIPQLAAIAGVLVWVAPDAFLANSTREGGFRGVTMLCGLVCILCALRLLDGSRRFADVFALGLFAGLGWWSSPEVAYFLVPAGLLTLGAAFSGGLAPRRWIMRLTVGVVGFVVGALPWLWANVNSGFQSLNPSSFPAGSLSKTGYWGRMNVFFHYALPIELNARRLQTGSYIFGGSGSGVRHAVGVTLTILVCAVLIIGILLCASRGGRWLAVASGVLAFPILYATQPGTWFWLNGQYAVFLGPLLVVAAVPGFEEAVYHFRRRNRRDTKAMTVIALSVGLAAAMILSLFALGGDNQTTVTQLASGWGNPNASADKAISTLRANGIRDGFADYWVAYKLDFLSGQALTITPAKGDVDRQPAFARTVALSHVQAWLFVPPSETTSAYAQFFTTIPGPDGITESRFLTALGILHVHYREINAGVLSAVVPSQDITINEVAAVPANA